MYCVLRFECVFTCVSLNNFVTLFVSFLLYVKVSHFVFRCCGLVSIFCFVGLNVDFIYVKCIVR
jgi:hypothetical protein